MLKNKLIDNSTQRQVGALEWNHIFTPQFLNSFRAGYRRNIVQVRSGPRNSVRAESDLGKLDIHLLDHSGP